MITVNMDINEEKKTLSLTLSGHAGQAAAGYDIICASATILAYTVAQVIKLMQKDKLLAKKPVIRLKEGDIEISCRCDSKENYASAFHTYFTAQVGYSLLAHNYPQYITFQTLGKPV